MHGDKSRIRLELHWPTRAIQRDSASKIKTTIFLSLQSKQPAQFRCELLYIQSDTAQIEALQKNASLYIDLESENQPVGGDLIFSSKASLAAAEPAFQFPVGAAQPARVMPGLMHRV